MSSASTVALVALATCSLAVAIRWPRPRTDARTLARRSHSLKVLGELTGRCAGKPSHQPPHPGAQSDLAQPDRLEPEPTPSPLTHSARPPLTTGGVTLLGTSRPAGIPETALRRPAWYQQRRAWHATARATPPPHRQPSPGADETHPHDAVPHDAVLRLISNDVPADVVPVAPSDIRTVSDSTIPATGRSGRGSVTPPSSARRQRRALATVGLTVTVATAAVILAASPSPTPAPSAAATTDANAPVEPAPAPPSAPPPIPPTSTLGDTVTFAVPAPATIAIAAAADSWVQVRTADGTIPFEGLVATGESTEVPVGGAVSIRLGNPAGVLVAADGRLLDHPRPEGEPLTLELG